MLALRLLLMAALLAPAPLSAQVIIGRAVDQAAAPVAGAELALLSADGQVLDRAVSDTAGVFRLATQRPGEYRIRATHVAYRQIESEPIRVGAAETVSVEVRLGTAAIPLEPIAVTARSADPRHAAFHERRLSRRQGTFITRAEIDRSPQARTTDLLRTVSGITILTTHEPGRSAMRSNFISIRGGGGMCEPAIYIDGVRVIQRVHSGMDEVLQPGMIEGVEIYTTAAAAPAGFGGHGNTCGVILFWTRIGRDPDARSVTWRQLLVGAGIIGAILLVVQ